MGGAGRQHRDDLDAQRRLHAAADRADGPRPQRGATGEPDGVAIVGCGLIGRKRAQALGGARLVACADLDRSARRALARDGAGRTAVDRLASRPSRDPDVDIVIVATTQRRACAEIAHGARRGRQARAGREAGGAPRGRARALIDAAAAQRRPSCGSASTIATTARCRRRASSSTPARSAR